MGRGSLGVGLALCAFVSGCAGGLSGGETGRLLWKARLPPGSATPMTYEIGGTQYGHGKLGATMGDYVVAFSLPRGRK